MPASNLKTLSARLKAHTLLYTHLFTLSYIYTLLYSGISKSSLFITSIMTSSHPALIFTVADVFFAVH